ncbi:DUF421 domain-containing protein [Sphingobacterium sp. Mn56C]|uniref:DUF421 domain-containing protein n=1 Tax=Sphingobacterium sp. Mn56C TaxID=3395261 RepID=UPI003BD1D826
MTDLLDIVFRSASVYIFMLIAIRIAGKKELSQLNTSDIVLILLISNAVQNAMVGSDSSLLGGLLAASILFVMNYIIKHIIYKNKKLRELLNDKPHILIHKGKLDFALLAQLGITNEELHEAMREHGIEHFRDVKLAMLEVDGNISIISDTGQPKITAYKRKHYRKGDPTNFGN